MTSHVATIYQWFLHSMFNLMFDSLVRVRMYSAKHPTCSGLGYRVQWQDGETTEACSLDQRHLNLICKRWFCLVLRQAHDLSSTQTSVTDITWTHKNCLIFCCILNIAVLSRTISNLQSIPKSINALSLISWPSALFWLSTSCCLCPAFCYCILVFYQKKTMRRSRRSSKTLHTGGADTPVHVLTVCFWHIFKVL